MNRNKGFKVRKNVGSAKSPLVIEWVGGKGGYLWVGDGDERCILTLSAAQSLKLAALIQAQQSAPDDGKGVVE